MWPGAANADAPRFLASDVSAPVDSEFSRQRSFGRFSRLMLIMVGGGRIVSRLAISTKMHVKRVDLPGRDSGAPAEHCLDKLVHQQQCAVMRVPFTEFTAQPDLQCRSRPDPVAESVVTLLFLWHEQDTNRNPIG